MANLKTYLTCSQCDEIWYTGCPICKRESPKLSVKVLKSKTIKHPKKQENKTAVRRKIKVYQPTPITIENFFINTYGDFKELNEIPHGFTQFFKSKGSAYYTNSDNTQLIRVSDHWGVNIKYCEWNLIGYKKVHCGKWSVKYGKDLKIGIINYTDFKENN